MAGDRQRCAHTHPRPDRDGQDASAFLWELNELIVSGSEEPLANAVHLVYISPLKALNNDIQRNLDQPLSELRERFAAAGKQFPEIRVGVRTGDTTPAARARMLRKSPRILITTPESLNIMLTSLRGRGMFSNVRAVIVDEIHAIAGTKRGAHLALTLERLDTLVGRTPQRIGLSATQRPLSEIARYLGGCEPGIGEGEPVFREVQIVDCGMTKKMHISVESPVADLGNVGGSVWPAVAPLVLRHIQASNTTLVFVNNRAQAERIAARVNALAAVELLRATAAEGATASEFVVMAASDPANVYNLPLELVDRDPLSRPRGSGSLLVMRGGRVAIAVEGRGRRHTVAEWVAAEDVVVAKKVLVEHLRGERGARYFLQ